MNDRNTTEALNKDIEFIQDILDYLEDDDISSAVDHLEDWQDELKGLKDG